MASPAAACRARDEMSSRRQREKDRLNSRDPRTPLSLSGRSSGLFCTPPSLAAEPPTSADERSERVRRDASARFEREKARLSTPPPAVVAAQPPAERSLGSSFDAAVVDKENSAPQPGKPAAPPTWEDALFVLEAGGPEAAVQAAADALADKIVWVMLPGSIGQQDDEVAARIYQIMEDRGAYLVCVEFLDHPGTTAAVRPADINLLSMRDLLELPPPPPPPSRPTDDLPINDENAPPPTNPDATPPALCGATVPTWAVAPVLDGALREQALGKLPPELATTARTCDLVAIFKRASLANRSHRETGDWSRDIWDLATAA